MNLSLRELVRIMAAVAVEDFLTSGNRNAPDARTSTHAEHSSTESARPSEPKNPPEVEGLARGAGATVHVLDGLEFER